jgi:hypothetical protein
MKNLLFQIKQFFKPFPAVGSWGYNYRAWQYDRRTGGPVKDNFHMEPLHPPESDNESNDSDILDIPTYIRRSLSSNIDPTVDNDAFEHPYSSTNRADD